MTALLGLLAWLGCAVGAEPPGVVDVQVSGGVVVPVSYTGSVPVGSVSIGTWLRDDMAIRLRLLGAPPPVPADGSVSDAWTWGARVSWVRPASCEVRRRGAGGAWTWFASWDEGGRSPSSKRSRRPDSAARIVSSTRP